MSDRSSPTSSQDERSMGSSNLSTKQYFLVNLSKFVVEIVGTGIMGTFYILMGNQQAGMLLGLWVVTLFGLAISGSHFNPAVTIAVMLRKNSSFGSRRLLGIIYIAGQFLGGIAAAFVSKFLADSNEFHNIQATPLPDYKQDAKIFSSIISELIGSFTFVFMFMLCTDKKT